MSAVVEPVVDGVEWHEGMLLAPQHFQLLAARMDTLIAWQTLAAAPFSWGVRKLQLDGSLLPAGVLRVQQLSAIMPDGAIIEYASLSDPGAGMEMSLEPYEDQLAKGPLTFYATVPKTINGRGDNQPRRFRSVCRAPVEDQVSEAQPVDIARQVLNLGLCVGAVPSGQYVHLPLGALYKDGEIIRLGERLPPLLELGPDSALWQAVASLLGQVRSSAALIARQTASPTSQLEDRLRQLELRDRLRCLLTGLPLAEAVLRTPQVHPWMLYTALVSLAGSLCMLRSGTVAPAFSEYSHADPLAVFTPLLRFLREVSSEVGEDSIQYKFEFNNGAFELGLRQEWLGERLVVGVRGASERNLLAWMYGAIVGSSPVFASLRSRRVLGAVRRHVDSVQALSLRSGSDYLLFEIEVDPELVVGQERLVIANPNETDRTQGPQEILLFVKSERSTP